MPDMQEVVALGVVALVAGRFIWKRWGRRNTPGKGTPSGDCGNCAASAPPPKEATVRFYRRQNAEGPASGASDDETSGDEN